MTRKIKIISNPVEMEARLNNTQIAKQLWQILPVESRINLWDEEIYFSIPLEVENEKPQEIVDIGDIAYWPPGNAFCLFFGPTPASLGDEIRPASPVTVIGKLLGSPQDFKKLKSGTKISLKKANNNIKND